MTTQILIAISFFCSHAFNEMKCQKSVITCFDKDFKMSLQTDRSRESALNDCILKEINK